MKGGLGCSDENAREGKCGKKREWKQINLKIHKESKTELIYIEEED